MHDAIIYALGVAGLLAIWVLIAVVFAPRTRTTRNAIIFWFLMAPWLIAGMIEAEIRRYKR